MGEASQFHLKRSQSHLPSPHHKKRNKSLTSLIVRILYILFNTSHEFWVYKHNI